MWRSDWAMHATAGPHSVRLLCLANVGSAYTKADLESSTVGDSWAVADHVRLLGYRAVTTGRWLGCGFRAP
jgi:hypothetical protein